MAGSDPFQIIRLAFWWAHSGFAFKFLNVQELERSQPVLAGEDYYTKGKIPDSL